MDFVRRLEAEEILIPRFQRNYVWSIREASRFIESLLLGLPVPGIFLANEPQTNKQLVIDGQQRLKTLQFFRSGFFNPKPEEKKQGVFALQKVQKAFSGKTYATLQERDRRRLDNSIIPATIVKQLAPSGSDTSLYHIFERLNSGGRKLTAQEIRVAIYHGPLINSVHNLNSYESWRKIFGKINPRLKDQEMILRFLALYYGAERYKRPMSEFVNAFAGSHRDPGPAFLKGAEQAFKNVIDLVYSALGAVAFRPERAINAAVFDSVMVGLARKLETDSHPEPSGVKKAYRKLLQQKDYQEKVSRSTADEAFVKARLASATRAFREL